MHDKGHIYVDFFVIFRMPHFLFANMHTHLDHKSPSDSYRYSRDPSDRNVIYEVDFREKLFALSIYRIQLHLIFQTTCNRGKIVNKIDFKM